MVYRGKPSKGCTTCRQRKVRCDLGVDGCNNCARLHRTCPGYRDQTDLMFLDETNAVKQKTEAQSRRASSHRSDSSQSLHLSDDPQSTSKNVQTRLPSPTKPLPPDIMDRAAGFFFTHLSLDYDISQRWRSDYLHCPETFTISENALMASIFAVGLAGLSNFENVAALRRKRNEQYSKALSLVNTSLTNPKEVTKDTTLMAVMLLGVFESMVGHQQSSLDTWANHVYGAASLLNLRGNDQFKSLFSFKLFVQVATVATSTCLRYATRLPDALLQITAEAKRYALLTMPQWQFFETQMTFVNFLAEVKERNFSDPNSVVNRAMELDHSFSLFLTPDRPAGRFQTFAKSNDAMNLGQTNYYHIYDSFLGAQVWNGIRVSRILLNQLVRSMLLLGFSAEPPTFVGETYTKLFYSTTETIARLSDDIVASVPQHLGDIPELQKRPQEAGDSQHKFLWSDFGRQEYNPCPFLPRPKGTRAIPLIRLYGGASLPWCICLVGDSDIATTERRQWAIGTLRRIGHTMGIKQALLLADGLHRRILPRNWWRRGTTITIDRPKIEVPMGFIPVDLIEEPVD